MDGMITQALSILAYQLPELLAASLVLALLRIRSRAGTPGRKLAVAGTAIVLVAALLRLVVGFGQAWLLSRGLGSMPESVPTYLMLYSGLMLLLSVASAVGLGLLGWGALQAMTGDQARTP